jgi:hypothetical protein
VAHNENDASVAPRARISGLIHPIPAAADVTHPEPPLREGDTAMIKWNHSALRVALALGAIASLVIGSGAGMRWS